MNPQIDPIKPLTVEEITDQLNLFSQVDVDQIAKPSWYYSSLDSDIGDTGGLLNSMTSNTSINTTTVPLSSITLSSNTTTGAGYCGNVPSISTIGTITPGTIGIGNNGIYTSTTPQSIFDFDSINDQRIEKLIKKNLKPIVDRLAILETPDPEVMEKFEALKMAYDHYRTLEALMHTEIQKIKEQK